MYIVPVNASILANVIGDGPNGPFGDGFVNYKQDLIVATAASCGIACILMGLMSNFPFALAPGMGTNAFFAFSIVLKYNIPWRTALSAIWIAGFVFAALSLLGVRTWLVRIMPACIRLAMACGIGLFLAFIGLKDMGLITNDGATFVTLNTPLSSNNPDFQKIWLSIVVLFIMGVLISRNVRAPHARALSAICARCLPDARAACARRAACAARAACTTTRRRSVRRAHTLTAARPASQFPGAILVGILFGTFVCWIDGAVVKFDATDPVSHPSHFCYPFGAINDFGNRVYGGGETPTTGGCVSSSYIVFPTKFAQKAACPNTCGQLSFKSMNSGAFGGALLTFLYTDILDNTGTFFAVAKIGGFLDPKTLQLPPARANMAYLADAISTIIGASLGVSTVVTYIESATGVRDGGRTGLTAICTGIMFLMVRAPAPRARVRLRCVLTCARRCSPRRSACPSARGCRRCRTCPPAPRCSWSASS